MAEKESRLSRAALELSEVKSQKHDLSAQNHALHQVCKKLQDEVNVLKNSLSHSAGEIDRLVREFKDSEIEHKKSPSLLLFLKASIEQLKKQIQVRGRSFEQDIEESYLKGIGEEYRLLLNSKLSFPILECEVDHIDFEKDEYAFQKILRAVFRASFL